jgi:hypothetical protein
MQAARGDFSMDSPAVEAEALQLTDGHDAVLPGRHHRQPSALPALR